MALVEPLGDDGVWYVQLAAIGTGSLLLCIYKISPPFLSIKKKNWYR